MELIVACTTDRIIGHKNKIPWSIPEDMSHFREKTKNNIVIMGRKTFESIGKLLKNRINIVITNSVPETKIRDLIFYENLEETILFAKESSIFLLLELIIKREGDKKIFVIGGSDIYKMFYKHCYLLHFTVISLNIDGDTKFPYNFYEIEKDYKTVYESEILYSDKNNIPYKFITYEKNKDAHLFEG